MYCFESYGFCSFFVDFSREITKKGLKWTIKVEKRLKKMFWPAFGCCKHPKAGRNTQHLGVWIQNKSMVDVSFSLDVTCKNNTLFFTLCYLCLYLLFLAHVKWTLKNWVFNFPAGSKIDHPDVHFNVCWNLVGSFNIHFIFSCCIWNYPT